MTRIRELRKSKKLRQSDLAAALQISQATLSNWESGRYEPDFEALKKMSDYFQVSVDYLLGGVKKEPAPTSTSDDGFDKSRVMAAFLGGDQSLTQEEQDALWEDVYEYARFKAEQWAKRKREEK